MYILFKLVYCKNHSERIYDIAHFSYHQTQLNNFDRKLKQTNEDMILNTNMNLMLVNPSRYAKFKTQRKDFHELYSADVVYMIDIIYLYDDKISLHIYCSDEQQPL